MRVVSAVVALCSSLAFVPLSVNAVIVAGANGGGNTTNNTTSSSLNDWAVSESLGPFPYFDNVINYSDASGVYLGANASGDIWVLSAKHVNDNNSALTIGLHSYNFQHRVNLADGDIELIRYRNVDGFIPDLPAITLATGIPNSAQPLVLIGIGKDRVQDAATDSRTSDAVEIAPGQEGYNWDAARVKRWGTNNMDSSFLNGGGSAVQTYSNTTGYSMDFDEPTVPQNPNADGEWLTSNEGIGSLGDSGGGIFFFTGSEWVLSATFSALSSFNGQPASTSAFGNATLTTEMSTYEEDINGITGVLIPEPYAPVLILLAAVLFTARRTRIHYACP